MIELLAHPPHESDLGDLAAVTLDAVESGASVSFMASLTHLEALEWWRTTIASAHHRALFLVARDDAGIVGTVQVQPAWPPNQPHRAEIAKLLVHRRARGKGIGRALMAAAEDYAAEAGFTLLTLDTKRGDAAEALYRRAGWTAVGTIPGYALNPDGTLCDTVIFYKRLRK